MQPFLDPILAIQVQVYILSPSRHLFARSGWAVTVAQKIVTLCQLGDSDIHPRLRS